MATQPIHWRPNPGPQTEVLRRSEFEILYGGARGGGKTDAGMVWMVEPQYIKNPRYKGLVIRRNSDDLSDWTARARVMYQPMRASFAGNPPKITFPSGAFIRTGHLKDENAFGKYQGHEYQKILIEELTQIPRESFYEMLIASARSTVEDLPAQVFCTANPGGPGHAWVKGRFVDMSRNRTYIPDGGRPRIFIPSTMDDNPVLAERDPEYVKTIESIKDENLRMAWRFGDWDRFSGQFFNMWSPERHVVRPFAIPAGWQRFRCGDFGYSAPACVLWMAVDYRGKHYIYRELYEANNTETVWARKVRSMSPVEEVITRSYYDPNIWARNREGSGDELRGYTRESIADVFIREGFYVSPANNDRLSGWAKIKDMLYWDANKEPMLVVFDNCVNLIRTMPSLVYSDTRPEDMDTTGEDHAADALRYGVMHTYQGELPDGGRERTWVEELLERITAGPEPEEAKAWEDV